MFVFANGSTGWAVGGPLIVAVVSAVSAFGYTLWLKRRDEKQELRALTRLLDAELAGLEWALEAFFRASNRSEDYARLRNAATVVQEAGSATVWNDTKLKLARHLSFDEWDTLRDVYAVIVALLGGELEPAADASEAEEMGLLEFNARSVYPRLPKVIPKARQICQAHQEGTPPVKVPLSDQAGAVGLSMGAQDESD